VKQIQIWWYGAFILLSTCTGGIYAQYDSIRPVKAFLSLNVSFHKGFIIPHSAAIRSVSYSKPWITEIDLAWHFSTEKAWQYCSCYPRIGLSAQYINFDNLKVLGRGYALTPYVEPFLSAYRKFSLSVRFAAGIIYLDNVYHPIHNPENLFYSSHISYLLSVSTAINYRLTSSFNIRLAGNYNHISNGGNREPNKGINFPTLSIGFDKYLEPVKFISREKATSKIPEKRSVFKLALLGTAKKPFPEENNRFLLFGIYFSWSYFLGGQSAFTTGLEYINDRSLKEFLKRTEASYPDHKKIGYLAGHEFQLGRFRFSQQLGIYLYSPAKAKDPVYQRWGLDFFVLKSFYMGANLKAHRHVADFMDFRVGIVW